MRKRERREGREKEKRWKRTDRFYQMFLELDSKERFAICNRW
jgi:hypothetical protein